MLTYDQYSDSIVKRWAGGERERDEPHMWAIHRVGVCACKNREVTLKHDSYEAFTGCYSL